MANIDLRTKKAKGSDALIKKTQKDLVKLLSDQRKSIEKYVGDVYKGKEKNVTKIRLMKKELARIKTVLVQKMGESSDMNKEGENA